MVDQGISAITAISTASNTITAKIPVGWQPTSLAFTPDSALAYVTNQFSNTLSFIDTSANARRR